MQNCHNRSLFLCFSCLFFIPIIPSPFPYYLCTQLFALNDPLAAAKALCRDHQRRSLQEAEEATAEEGGGPEREARCREPEEGPDSRHQVSFSFCLCDHFIYPVIPADSVVFLPSAKLFKYKCFATHKSWWIENLIVKKREKINPHTLCEPFKCTCL